MFEKHGIAKMPAKQSLSANKEDAAYSLPTIPCNRESTQTTFNSPRAIGTSFQTIMIRCWANARVGHVFTTASQQVIHPDQKMIEQINSSERLNAELSYLRQQNQVLSAELAFHKKMFRQVHEALGAASQMSGAIRENQAVKQLAEENERLKSQLKFARLSDREREIMQYAVQGHTSKEIANLLNISKLTVDTHRKHLLAKLEVENMAQLISLATQVGLV